MERANSTFLFADLAGFTALTEAHGDELAADLAEAFAERLRAMAPHFSCEIVKCIGDAVMVRSDSSRSAIDFGLTVVETMEPDPKLPSVRVGLHSGSAVERSGDWYGSSVNIAARVASQAAGAEVLLTDAALSAAGELESIEVERLGERDLRNILEPVLIFRAHRRLRRPGKVGVDPVCRMAIPEGAHVGSLAYEGVTYVFCSLGCAQRFAGAPDRYLP